MSEPNDRSTPSPPVSRMSTCGDAGGEEGERATTTGEPVSDWPALRWRMITLVVVAGLFLPVAYGALKALGHSGTRVADWLPEAFPETALLRKFERRFGSDELLMISWPGLRAGSDSLEQLRRGLLSGPSEGGNSEPFFGAVWTADSISRSLTAPPLDLSTRQVDARLRGWILGRDGAGAAVALVTDPENVDRPAAVRFARRVATRVSGLPVEEIRMAGATIESVAIDEASRNSLVLLNVGSAVLCIGLIALCTRQFVQSFVIFAVSAFFQFAAMALIHFSGGQMDSILLLTANLSGVLSISASIHMLGYFRDASANPGDERPVWTALRRALLPTSLAALTTSIGFGSLAMGDVIPIRNFGLYSAIAAPVSVTATLWLLAVGLHFTPLRGSQRGRGTRRESASEARAAAASSPAPVLPHPAPLLGHAEFCARQWRAILLGFAGVFIGCGYSAASLQTSVGIHDLFPADAKLLDDYQWLEQAVGPLVPIEVVIGVPADASFELRDQIVELGRIQSELLELEQVGTAYSALNYCPPELIRKSRGGISGILTNRVLQSQQTRILEVFERYRLLHQSEQGRYWRISVRVPASVPHDFPDLMKRVEAAAIRAIDRSGRSQAMSVEVVGGIPLAAKTQQRLLYDLGRSFLTAFALIAITIAVVLRSPIAGFATVLPSAAPAIVVFGLMSLFGAKAGIGGVMTASVVLGIAVDDSLHFVLAFRSAIRKNTDPLAAVSTSLAVCRPAIVQTSVIVGVGMLIFTLSPFLPIRRFALLMFSLLGVGLVINLSVLPAILLSPLGRFFYDSKA